MSADSRMFADLSVSTTSSARLLDDGPPLMETSIVCTHNGHRLVFSAVHQAEPGAIAYAVRDATTQLRNELTRLFNEALSKAGLLAGEHRDEAVDDMLADGSYRIGLDWYCPRCHAELNGARCCRSCPYPLDDREEG